MDVLISRRASIAVRSLDNQNQKKLKIAFDFLAGANIQSLYQSLKVRKLNSQFGGDLFVYKLDQKLRIVFSVQSNTITIEDVTSPDKLDRLIGD